MQWLGRALLVFTVTAAAHGQSIVTLAWDPSPDPTVVGYILYEGGASGDYTNATDVGNATSATVSNLVWGCTYYFAVAAYDTNDDESPLSGEISFTVPFPTNTTLAFTPDSGTFTDSFTAVNLAWYPSPDSGVAGYYLHEGVASGSYTNLIDVGNSTNAIVSNLVWGATYYFAVTAYYTNGQESPLSSEISFTVPFPTNTILTFTPDSGTFTDSFTAVNLAWYPSPDSGVAGYHLHEGVASGSYTNLIDVGNSTNAIVSNLVWGATYYFAVTAVLHEWTRKPALQ